MNGSEAEKIRQKIENGNFFASNGRILQTLNILAGDFKKLTDLKYVLPDIDESEMLRSIDYLYEGGYIKLRNTESRKAVALSDVKSYKELSAKLTADGVRILVGAKADECIEL